MLSSVMSWVTFQNKIQIKGSASVNPGIGTVWNLCGTIITRYDQLWLANERPNSLSVIKTILAFSGM